MKTPRHFRATSLSRRQFLRHASTSTAALALGPMIVPSRVLGANGQTPPSEKVRLAAIGVAGQGGADLNWLAAHRDGVALCDVDARHATGTFEKFPAAKRFTDFRKMFDEAASSFDAVLVATPDHT